MAATHPAAVISFFISAADTLDHHQVLGLRNRFIAPGDLFFQLKMGEAGFSRAEIERATQLWSDMQAHCALRVTKPEVLAAALEYAIAVVEQRPGCTQAEVARRYGVAPTSVSARFAQIRNALALRPGDPRYAASR